MVYLCGIHFVVRGRSELRAITYGQLSLDSDHDGTGVLRYQQTVANKTNQGGQDYQRVQWTPEQRGGRLQNDQDKSEVGRKPSATRYVIHFSKVIVVTTSSTYTSNT